MTTDTEGRLREQLEFERGRRVQHDLARVVVGRGTAHVRGGPRHNVPAAHLAKDEPRREPRGPCGEIVDQTTGLFPAPAA